MDAEPPTTRFEVDARSRRPGHRNRSPSWIMTSAISMSNSADNCGVVASDLSFADCIAEGVYFETARLTRVSFVRCDMYWASFLMATLHETTFEHCDLRGADFTDAELKNCRFLNCDVGTDAIGGETQFGGASLSDVEFLNCRGR